MASSINFKTDNGRIRAMRIPFIMHWRQMFMAFLVLLMLPTTLQAQEDEDAKANALVLTAQGQVFKEVVSGISGDLEEDLNFVVYTVGKSSQVSEIEQQINTLKPKIIILVENNSINLYAKYQKANPNKKFPPSIALAALFVDNFVSKLKNATGIRYEIPAVTAAVTLRNVMSTKMKKVGVVHREWMTDLIKQNAKYCEAEGIELVSVVLPNKDSKMDSKLNDGLKSLIKQDVDALWILNDNALLNAKMLKNAWLPVVGKAKLPVIVGVRPLLNTKWNFGSFAIVPDHYGLGVQAASIIGEIMDEEWEIGDRDIEQPVSVKKIVNISVLDNKNVKYIKDKLSSMDEVVQ